MISIPETKDGEVYAGAIIAPDRTGHHVILLDGDNDDAEWQTQMDWAKSIGGDLPSLPEYALLHAFLKDRFREDCYWSNEQYADYPGSAGVQIFISGDQVRFYKACILRARAVRRVPIVFGREKS